MVGLVLFLAVVGFLLGMSIRNLARIREALKRNDEVYEFRTRINKVYCKEYVQRRLRENKFDDWEWPQDWSLNKYSYEEMLYSDRPLTLEAWWSSEEIEKLMS